MIVYRCRRCRVDIGAHPAPFTILHRLLWSKWCSAVSLLLDSACKPRQRFPHRRVIIFTLFWLRNCWTMDVAIEAGAWWDETEYSQMTNLFLFSMWGCRVDSTFFGSKHCPFPITVSCSLFSILCSGVFLFCIWDRKTNSYTLTRRQDKARPSSQYATDEIASKRAETAKYCSELIFVLWILIQNISSCLSFLYQKQNEFRNNHKFIC